METQELHRGRLIDHIQLVVRDLAASQAFYTAALGALKVPMGGADEGYFWADELFVSSADSPAAQGHLTGRTHLGVATIAYTLGYADPAYFTRAFTRDAGLSPRSFRAQVAASSPGRIT